jgi:hypothetical protein
MPRKPARNAAAKKTKKSSGTRKSEPDPVRDYLAARPDRKLPDWAKGELRVSGAFRFFLGVVALHAEKRKLGLTFGEGLIRLSEGGTGPEFEVDLGPLVETCSEEVAAEWDMYTQAFFNGEVRQRRNALKR